MKEIKKAEHTKRRASHLSDEELWRRGKLVELMLGRLIGAKVDVTAERGGDGHSGDLITETLTIGVKCLKRTETGYYQTMNQGGSTFRDDLGILCTHDGDPSDGIRIVGWFTEEDWTTFGHYYKAYDDPVFGIQEKDLRSWETFDEAFQAIETRRRERGIRQRLRGGRMYVFDGQMCVSVDHEVPLSGSLR